MLRSCILQICLSYCELYHLGTQPTRNGSNFFALDIEGTATYESCPVSDSATLSRTELYLQQLGQSL
jgi:hypothetical protein